MYLELLYGTVTMSMATAGSINDFFVEEGEGGQSIKMCTKHALDANLPFLCRNCQI